MYRKQSIRSVFLLETLQQVLLFREIEEIFQTMLEYMPENMGNVAIKEFGSVEHWKEHYMEVVSSEKMQKGYVKVVEWYGE